MSWNWPVNNLPVEEAQAENALSPDEFHDLESAKVVWKGYVPWTTRDIYRKTFLGYPDPSYAQYIVNNIPKSWNQIQVSGNGTISTASTFGVMRRQIPAYHPDWPNPFVSGSDAAGLWCESMKFAGSTPAGLGALDRTAKFDRARTEATFTNRTYRVFTDAQLIAMQTAGNWNNNAADPAMDPTYPQGVPDEASLLRYVTIEYYPRGRYQTLPGMGALHWNGGDGGDAVSNTTAYTLVEGEVHAQWAQVPLSVVPYGAWNACMGKTNRYKFGFATTDALGQPITSGIGTNGFIAPGRLLCLQPKMRRPYMLANGKYGTDISVVMQYFPYGPNTLLRFSAAAGATPLIFWNSVSRNGRTIMDQDTGRVSDFLTGNLANPANLLVQPANFNSLFRPARRPEFAFPPGPEVPA